MKNARSKLTLSFSCFLLLFLLLTQPHDMLEATSAAAPVANSPQSTEKALSSEGAMRGITLQGTRVYPFKGPAEPKTIVWKSEKLFSLRKTQSLSGQMGTLDYVVWYPTYHGYSSPIVADDMIYFSLYVGDGYFFVRDSNNGEGKKTLRLKDTSVSPIAVAGDYVFMGTSDGNFRALNRKTGEVKWQVNRKDYRFDVTAPVVAAGVLLFGGAQNIIHQNTRPGGTLHAFDALSGQQIWMFRIKGAATSPAVAGATVYFGDEDSNLFAVDITTGKEKWRYKAGGNIRTHAIAGDQIYFSDGDGDLYAAEKETGRLVWKATKIPKVRTVLAVDNGIIYYGGGDNLVYAVEAKTGEEKWRFKAGGSCSAPVVAGGVLYFVSADKSLYAVDGTTGQGIWKYKCPTSLSVSPIITQNALYLLDDDGYLFSLR